MCVPVNVLLPSEVPPGRLRMVLLMQVASLGFVETLMVEMPL